MEKWQRRPASILWAPSNIFFQQSTRRHESYKIASAMHTIVFVDWSIEAKIAQVAHESEIFDGFVPTMMQWCDGFKHCDRNEENDENNCFDPPVGG